MDQHNQAEDQQAINRRHAAELILKWILLTNAAAGLLAFLLFLFFYPIPDRFLAAPNPSSLSPEEAFVLVEGAKIGWTQAIGELIRRFLFFVVSISLLPPIAACAGALSMGIARRFDAKSGHVGNTMRVLLHFLPGLITGLLIGLLTFL